ncbi:Hsp33 family molecular chaperone HslO [Craterilacuibacter sp. RT1T]|uniref:Hsp33 family molecular chaperone HslO n=1 Tax=Craterilacuibacter sp. RT1T TaxID=2942211 RepID=UPI0020C14677|nr:Hsp33 family molecular chaperone HslO [Craterilacuibacter sp. RT1T]MCL6263907.1 Hsp33 family molecular chaperone HslO [Craterilacuibacter sp. RT1T]
MNQTDTLQRFIFDDAPVRGALVRLDDAWQAVLSRRHYPAPVRDLVGQMMAASALLAANLKFDGTLIMQIQGKGALKLAVVESNADRTLRATAKWDEVKDGALLAELVGVGAQFVITLDPKEGQPWQGIVALEGDSLAQMLENYMQRSEQLDTKLVLAADAGSAAGMLLQRLPEGHGDAEGWNHVQTLASTLKGEELLELPATEILHRLYHDDEVRLFDAETLAFACNCSQERVGDMLKMLGGEEVANVILEQGSIEIHCEFCNQQYVFDEDDVNALFHTDVVHAVREARH